MEIKLVQWLRHQNRHSPLQAISILQPQIQSSLITALKGINSMPAALVCRRASLPTELIIIGFGCECSNITTRLCGQWSETTKRPFYAESAAPIGFPPPRPPPTLDWPFHYTSLATELANQPSIHWNIDQYYSITWSAPNIKLIPTV